MSLDLGQRTLSTIFDQLKIDAEWSIRRDRDFSWIASRLEQTVTASKPVNDDGFLLYKISARTVVVEDVKAAESQIDRILSDINRFAVGNAYSHDPIARNIVATTSTWIHEETAGWRSEAFFPYVMSQLCLAESEADYLAEACDGVIGHRTHPASGDREAPDDMLNFIEHYLARFGEEGSRYADAEEYRAIADEVERSETIATLGGSADGICLERMFGEYSAITILNPTLAHRRLGAGLDCRIHLPAKASHVEGLRLASMLNRLEQDRGPFASHLGAWCLDSKPGGGLAITYRSFGLNTVHVRGMAMEFARAGIGRMRWADRVFNHDATSGDIWELLKRRFSADAGE